jgi:RNA polymerase sigma-70 factor (ECF subfamily)
VADEVAVLTARDPSSADLLERHAWSDEVARALAELGEEAREAFLLRYLEDLSYEEMAEMTGAGVSALKMRVKRACERLRWLLTEAQHA